MPEPTGIVPNLLGKKAQEEKASVPGLGEMLSFEEVELVPLLGQEQGAEQEPESLVPDEMVQQPQLQLFEPNQDFKNYGSAEEQQNNLNKVFPVIAEFFPSATAQAALLGSIAVEAPSFLATQKEVGVDVGGVGLFQFTNQHRDRYERYRKEHRLEDSARSQMMYMRENLYGDGFYTEKMGYGNAKKIREAFKGKDPQLAAELLLDRFFKPEDREATRVKRKTHAQGYYDQIINL